MSMEVVVSFMLRRRPRPRCQEILQKGGFPQMRVVDGNTGKFIIFDLLGIIFIIIALII